MKEKLTVFGYSGSAEELKTLLEAGLRITAMTQDGSSYVIEYDNQPKVGRPQKVDKERILSLRAAGQSYAAIGAALGCSKAYIIKVCKAEAGAEPVEVPAPQPEDCPEPEPEAALKQNNLKELRKKAGLTQKQLSDRTGIKLKTLQDWERTGKPIDGDVFRYLLARELHCRADELPR